MVVEVSTPSAMVMLQNFHVETVVESHLEAAVTLKTDNGDVFSYHQWAFSFIYFLMLLCFYIFVFV